MWLACSPPDRATRLNQVISLIAKRLPIAGTTPSVTLVPSSISRTNLKPTDSAARAPGPARRVNNAATARKPRPMARCVIRRLPMAGGNLARQLGCDPGLWQAALQAVYLARDVFGLCSA